MIVRLEKASLVFKEGFFSMRLTIDGYDFALRINIFSWTFWIQRGHLTVIHKVRGCSVVKNLERWLKIVCLFYFFLTHYFPVVCHPMSAGSLMPIFEGFFKFFSLLSIYFLLKQLMNLLPFPPPHFPTNYPISLKILILMGIWVNSSVARETDSSVPEKLDTAFLSVLF